MSRRLIETLIDGEENNLNSSQSPDEGDDDDDEAPKMEFGVRPRKRKDGARIKKKRKIRGRLQSGGTQEERRELRMEQKKLNEDIEADSLPVDHLNKFASESGANNLLWDDVRYTREAVLDAKNLDAIANKSTRNAEKLVQVSETRKTCPILVTLHP